jgi:hypothetical protein
MEPQLCRIETALGRSTECPRAACAFWRDGACAVAGLRANLPGSPDLAEWLLRLRQEIGGPSWHRALLPPGLR